MSNLGDYLGLLLSEIAMARMQADLETVRIAELYASHPLLRRMAVPHIRLPDVDLDVPVLIKEAQAPRQGESTRGGVPLVSLRQRFEEVLKAELGRSGVTLTAAMSERLTSELNLRDQLQSQPTELAIGVTRIADDYTTTAMSVLRAARGPDVGPGPTPRPGATAAAAVATATAPAAAPAPSTVSARTEGFVPPPIDEKALRDTVRTAFLQMRAPPPRLDVIVTSAEIREGATSDNVARIRMKITEQGVEWATIQTNGAGHDVLVPE